MTCIRKLALAFTLALMAGSALAVAPASAGACDQQGRRVLIKGVWHKVVRVNTPTGSHLVDCGLGW